MPQATQSKHVLIFKKKDVDDKYDALLKERGYVPEFIPVLDHQLTNIEMLKDIIITNCFDENCVEGLIVTSQRAVEALNQACQLALSEVEKKHDSLSLCGKWKSVPAYIVGPQTAEALAKLPLFHENNNDDDNQLDTYDASVGDNKAATKNNWIIAPRATELIPSLLDHYANYRKQQAQQPILPSSPNGTTTAKTNMSVPVTLLFLAGDKRRDVIPEALKEAHVPYKELQVYATCAHPHLKQNLTTYLAKYCLLENDPTIKAGSDAVTTTSMMTTEWWTVYFSPSGIKFILSNVDDPNTREILLAATSGQDNKKEMTKEERHHRRRPRIAAIGPTTADYLSTSLNIRPDVIADKPDAVHLVQSILNFDAHNQ
ncbi:tetrapyrrole biosynthesis, uroporphyrinogen III synthase [Mycotypha africana]|uniref:tetrapyrrole biosynthesis, uroporphyrinogen III synthase n=1 Tax=Mycotypha africana TaxID=64632 RepID=UPI002301C539|nr:tetrapyrrole biosynthesis, uroporphyrinogen III synthase [Mycotypha africana]KAI8984093.1 tetrapyrrole biosynthesis, uroporphyrinogen III synthase [Mycotypha africana]